MIKFDAKLMKILDDNSLYKDLFKGLFGLEKENVRITKKGNLALTPHPVRLGNKAKHPYITTDFSESQVEIITPPMPTLDDAYNMLETLHNIVAINIGDEYLWPQSTPPILPESHMIPIANFGNESLLSDQTAYRQELAKKYGTKKQLISGIHFNFSFDEVFVGRLHKVLAPEVAIKTFKSDLYLKIMRNTLKHSWLIIKLLGCSPVIHPSFSPLCSLGPSRTSVRNGMCGYNNYEDYYVPLESLPAYVKGINQLISNGHLSSEKEYYSLIRPKNIQGDPSSLLDTGIDYLELRLIDLNPLYKLGISKDDLYLLHSFLLTMALLEDVDLNQETFKNVMKRNRRIADTAHTRISAEDQVKTTELISHLKEIASLKPHDDAYIKAITNFEARLKQPEKLYSTIIASKIKEEGYIAYHLNLAKIYLDESKAKEFNYIGYEDMELSTQILILDALRRGIKVDILDRFENFIKLSEGERVEVIKQATKTSKDTYSSVLVMENKKVTKKLLEAQGIKTPPGGIYEDITTALNDYDKYSKQAIVIKPNTTNFGLGITIFKDDFDQVDYKKALDHAFSYDKSVLIESFVMGKEYRIFVIGDQVVAAMHRVPANVTGDGKSTIRDLVTEKNMSNIRGTGYRKPLQKIALGLEEEMFLAQSGLTFDAVPNKGQTVYLRENSNISTGGDSIDMTHMISTAYKQIAVAAAKAVGASITGVDLITPDITSEKGDNYSIIELNFNPAIHIHCYPYKGNNQHLGDKILNHLGFN